MADRTRPDLCIVGAGALGRALALQAASQGASVVLVDRGAPEPGDGPQQCLRLASLQASAARAHAIRTAERVGLSNSQPKLSLRSVQDRALDIAAEQSVETADARLAAMGITIVSGAAQFSGPTTLQAGDDSISARAFVLAIGGAALVPAIPGLDAVDHFTLDTILDNSRKLTHLLVIGNDPAGLVAAQAYARLGSQVTLVPQGKLLEGFDSEAVAVLLGLLSEEGVHVVDGASVAEIVPRNQGTGAVVNGPAGKTLQLDVSHILVACGREADLTPLQPDVARIRSGRAGNRRIRLAGAAASINTWPDALAHGHALVEGIIAGRAPRKLAHRPRLLMTEPALAEIGQFPEKAAPGQRLYRENFFENEHARALGAASGSAKVMANAKGQVVAASLVGPGAADLAGVLALVMAKGLSLDDLATLAVPQPSLMEVLVRLGQSHAAQQAPSAWAQRRRSLRRVLRG